MKALVVDDVIPMQNLLGKILRACGVDEVVTAGSAREALDQIRAEDVDLIFLDIHLPDMSGLEVLKKVREESSELFVVVVTGYEEPETVQQIVRFGASRYIVKPIKFDEIRLAVELWQRIHAYRQPVE